jgi:hypothetical protein
MVAATLGTRWASFQAARKVVSAELSNQRAALVTEAVVVPVSATPVALRVGLGMAIAIDMFSRILQHRWGIESSQR